MNDKSTEYINNIIQKEKDRKPQENGFFPLDIFKKKEQKEEKQCNDHEHDPPKYLHIPQGQGYRHICPSCGKPTVIIPSQVTM